MPFHQIHGHNYIYLFETNNWWPSFPKRLKERTVCHHDSRSTFLKTINGSVFIGIDPGFNFHADVKQQPMLKVTIF